ncbi:MAG TPA: DUF2752 domain-containing protein [Phycisphaerales bacterium]|nr:DUF2752 domain-containing protein [Phycisphaerales bacterium]
MSEAPAILDAAPLRARAVGGARRASARVRWAALVGAGACLALLVVASRLAPEAAGHGTHTQLGLPPCAWAEALGKPCMTCGMTTAFAYAARGDLLDSARTQPFGFVLAVLTAATGWGALHVAATGSMLAAAASRMLTPRLLWTAGAMLLAAWGYKVLTWHG